jgi:DNA-binding beta-propeller fold protein YncE
MNTKLLKLSGLPLLIVLLVLGCPMPTIPGPAGSGGSLTIQVGNHINSQTLLPPISMNPVSYTVTGSGPGGATFSQTTTGAAVTVNSLAFGSWNITVNALNSDGTLIGSGQAAASVHTGQTTTVAISVVPLSGNGTLNLAVSWTASQVETPSIVASLTPPVGSATPLSFSVNGNQATYSSTTIPAGYQTLTVQLLDNNTAVMGAVEVVRIVAGQTTSGTYAFTNVNQPGGSVQVNITPALADPIPVSISGVPATISAGTSITATASVSDGTTGVVYVWYLNGVSVGTGASFTFGSALAAGYYRLDVTAYTATRAGSATASFQVTGANASSGGHMYVASRGSNSISAYSIGSGGMLTPLSIPTFAAGSLPSGIAVRPGGSFLYVTNYDGNTVSAYAIGADGLLTPLSVPAFTAKGGPEGIVITPNGSFLYVTNQTVSTVSAFAIGSGGLLTPLRTPAFVTGDHPYAIAVSPNGSFLYVGSSNDGTISAYAIGADGLLTPLSVPTFAAGGSPQEIVITPNGSFLYVTNQNVNSIAAFAVGSGGLLTPLSTPSFSTGTFPTKIAVTPDGSFLYVTNFGSNTVSGYVIGSSGLLTPLSTSSYATGNAPLVIAVSPSGSFLYVSNDSGSGIFAYAIGPGGLLTPLSTPTFATGASPQAIAIAP